MKEKKIDSLVDSDINDIITKMHIQNLVYFFFHSSEMEKESDIEERRRLR